MRQLPARTLTRAKARSYSSPTLPDESHYVLAGINRAIDSDAAIVTNIVQEVVEAPAIRDLRLKVMVWQLMAQMAEHQLLYCLNGNHK